MTKMKRKTKSYLWLWFIAAFVVQLGAWAAWFAVAAQNKVAEVPLATAKHHKG